LRFHVLVGVRGSHSVPCTGKRGSLGAYFKGIPLCGEALEPDAMRLEPLDHLRFGYVTKIRAQNVRIRHQRRHFRMMLQESALCQFLSLIIPELPTEYLNSVCDDVSVASASLPSRCRFDEAENIDWVCEPAHVITATCGKQVNGRFRHRGSGEHSIAD